MSKAKIYSNHIRGLLA